MHCFARRRCSWVIRLRAPARPPSTCGFDKSAPAASLRAMPFTPAHAAAALPFGRVRALPLDALVVGTMVPDLPLFVSFAPNYAFTHSLVLALPVCLPWGIGLWLLARLARPSTVWLMPEWMRKRVSEHAP